MEWARVPGANTDLVWEAVPALTVKDLYQPGVGIECHLEKLPSNGLAPVFLGNFSKCGNHLLAHLISLCFRRTGHEEDSPAEHIVTHAKPICGKVAGENRANARAVAGSGERT